MPMLGQARVQRTWRKQAMAMLVDRFERPYILLLHASFVVVATWLVVHAWLPSLSLSTADSSRDRGEISHLMDACIDHRRWNHPRPLFFSAHWLLLLQYCMPRKILLLPMLYISSSSSSFFHLCVLLLRIDRRDGVNKHMSPLLP